MSDQLAAASQNCCTRASDMTREQAVTLWLDVMESCHLFLLAGIEKTSKTPEEARAAFSDWYRQHMQEHDRMIIHLARNFHERSERNAPQSDH